MRNFESAVQNIKYKIFKELVTNTINNTLEIGRYKIPKTLVPGPNPIMRCCIHTERAIVEERVELILSAPENKLHIIDVIGTACDQCPTKRFTITEACRGCFANRCVNVCPRNAIVMHGGKAVINHDLCIECGKCEDVCPFNAVADVMRSCKKACGSNAIEMDENKIAVINRDKCTSCGSCVYKCPFGAIVERSELITLTEEIEKAKKENKNNFYAIIAPAISSQFNTTVGKVVNAIKKIGFHDVVEAALGADIVAYYEGKEFLETVASGSQNCLISSCCPAFVTHVEKNYPELMDKMSTTVSPMIAMARLIKKLHKDAIVVFMGPCTAKKVEGKQTDVEDAVDYVLTFEELEAMIDAYNINFEDCDEAILDNASYFGRIFARSGGLTDAVAQSLKEQGGENVNLKAITCDGITECDKSLKLLKFNRFNGNFIEGMACKGGCIGGAASLTHGPKDKTQVDKYASSSLEKSITQSIRILDLNDVELHRHDRKHI